MGPNHLSTVQLPSDRNVRLWSRLAGSGSGTISYQHRYLSNPASDQAFVKHSSSVRPACVHVRVCIQYRYLRSIFVFQGKGLF